MHESIKEKFKKLRLSGMYGYFKEHYPEDLLTPQCYFELVSEMLELEINRRTLNKQTLLLKDARLRWPNVTLNNISKKHHSKQTKLKIKQLSDCEWSQKSQSIIITGATGVGKTELACAFARECILKLIPVRFFRFHELLMDLSEAKDKKQLRTFTDQLLKVKVWVIDDWGIAPLDELERHLLYRLIESRENSGSIIITSQYDCDDWHHAFGDAMIADAVLDRIVHSSHQLVLTGDSRRKLAGIKGGIK